MPKKSACVHNVFQNRWFCLCKHICVWQRNLLTKANQIILFIRIWPKFLTSFPAHVGIFTKFNTLCASSFMLSCFIEVISYATCSLKNILCAESRFDTSITYYCILSPCKLWMLTYSLCRQCGKVIFSSFLPIWWK